jgi:hypothetical protein
VTDRPLDVYDISGMRPRQTDQNPTMGDHWYWCRQHERAEHVGWTMISCVRIGPFMSEREANRLAGQGTTVHGTTLVLTVSLGMEVEH